MVILGCLLLHGLPGLAVATVLVKADYRAPGPIVLVKHGAPGPSVSKG